MLNHGSLRRCSSVRHAARVFMPMLTRIPLAAQIKQLEEKYDRQEPLGPHGSARPNQQTIADLKEVRRV